MNHICWFGTLDNCMTFEKQVFLYQTVSECDCLWNKNFIATLHQNNKVLFKNAFKILAVIFTRTKIQSHTEYQCSQTLSCVKRQLLLFFLVLSVFFLSRLHSSVQISGPFMDMWSRLSSILFERQDPSLVLILFIVQPPCSSQALDIGKLRIVSASKLRSGKRNFICTCFLNTTLVCDSRTSLLGSGILSLAMWNLNNLNSATTSDILSGTFICPISLISPFPYSENSVESTACNKEGLKRLRERTMGDFL